MDTKVPLGKREAERLEFKAAAALRNPFSISREVVAMLNARGGDIWIGLSEAGGLATEVENIPHAERARVDLLNHMIEVIEPRIVADEVKISSVEHSGRNLLRATVNRHAAPGRPQASPEEGPAIRALRLLGRASIGLRQNRVRRAFLP